MAFAAMGCIDDPRTRCPADLACPSDRVCDGHGGCAWPEQVAVCHGQVEGQRCAYPSEPNGLCRQGLCVPANCGNAIVTANEVCDDGNTQNGDGCAADCLSDETCGNGRVDSAKGEQCDDGNHLDQDGCQNDCKLPRCGDGIIDVSLNEACDDGAANGLAPDAACRPNCQLRRCGDGVRDSNEICDDGNVVAGDGCSADCKSDEMCGNGYVDIATGEACDDGNSDDLDACLRSCRIAGCGDGFVHAANGETCDAGEANANTPDAACRTNCQPQRCGDGILDGGEACDDGNVVSGDGCSGDCQSTEVCGNGYIDALRGEQCDTGVAGLGADGCSSICRSEVLAWRDLSLPGVGGYDMGIAYDERRKLVVAFGGEASFFNNNTWEFDGFTWRLRKLAASPPPLTGVAMVYDATRQRIVVYGGIGEQSAVDQTWEYDGVTWKQREFVLRPHPRLRHAMVYDHTRQRAVMFGGRHAGLLAENDTWEYDGQQWLPRELAVAPAPRFWHAMTYDENRDVVVLFGGSDGSTLFNDTWEFDGVAWQQRVFAGDAPVPAPREGARMVYDLAQQRSVLFGGRNGSTYYRDIWQYDGQQWVQVFASVNAISARALGGLAYDTDRRRTIIFGGRNAANSFGDTSFYANGVFSTSGVLPFLARALASMTYDAMRQRLVLLGGIVSSTSFPLQEQWEFDGLTWARVVPATQPPARAGHSMVYDEVRHCIVLFGGRVVVADTSGGLTIYRWIVNNDTWEFDGITWRKRTLVHNPPARVHSHMAYDAERERVVLYGGSNAVALPAGPEVSLSDTWEYDGEDWQLRTDVGAPPPRAYGAMAYLPTTQRVVFFGGQHNYLNYADTWQYDGVAWQQVATGAAPRARHGAEMQFDPRLGGLVLFGGAGSGYYRDAWLWNGQTWSELAVRDVPKARAGHWMGYHAASRQMVMGGGVDGQTYPTDVLGLAYTGFTSAPVAETCRYSNEDADGDGRAGCADPDCWHRCDPLCPPATSCDAARGRCGDGICDEFNDREDYLICPNDCSAP